MLEGAFGSAVPVLFLPRRVPDDPVAHAEPLDVRADRDHGAGDVRPEDRGEPQLREHQVPEEPADGVDRVDRDGLGTDDEFAGAGLGDRSGSDGEPSGRRGPQCCVAG